ncbi:MAG: acyltransferase [Bacteroides sp.]|nr:acyltransferase [Bacteroides sp.]MCM1413240.1 acyltransferase [Bacteroides sp.]MCM1471450.1 acyltransferase [Bacteroides sp.]
MTNQSNHYFAIDVTKMVLAVLVVCIHCQRLFESQSTEFLFGSICDLAVPLFFAFSGFFFAQNCNVKKSVKRLLAIYLFYLFFSWPLCIRLYKDLTLIQAIKRTLFMGPTNVGWYAVALIWCMIIVFLFMKIKKKWISYACMSALAILLYVMCLSEYSYIGLKDTIIGDLTIYSKYILHDVRYSFCQGLIYFLIGFFVAKTNFRLSIYFGIILALIGIGLFFYENYTILVPEWGYDMRKNNISLPICTFGLLMFILSLCRPSATVVQGALLRQASTILYFSHPMLIFLTYRATGVNHGSFALTTVLIAYSIIFFSYIKLRDRQWFGWLKYAC